MCWQEKIWLVLVNSFLTINGTILKIKKCVLLVNLWGVPSAFHRHFSDCEFFLRVVTFSCVTCDMKLYFVQISKYMLIVRKLFTWQFKLIKTHKKMKNSGQCHHTIEGVRDIVSRFESGLNIFLLTFFVVDQGIICVLYTQSPKHCGCADTLHITPTKFRLLVGGRSFAITIQYGGSPLCGLPFSKGVLYW